LDTESLGSCTSTV